MAKILVTGSNGFIGSELISYLQNKGHYVNSINVDIRDKEKLKPHFLNIEFVVHAAGKVRKGIPNQEDYYLTNVFGTRNVAELCIENSLKLIHLSSVVTNPPYKEEIPYVISKLASQNLIQDLSIRRNLKVVVLKLCVIYNSNNNTGRRGARYPIEKLNDDIEKIIQFHDFSTYELRDYSNVRI